MNILTKSMIKSIQKENFFSKLKNKCPEDDEITRTKEISKVFDIKNGEELTNLHLKSDAFY